MPRVNGVKDTDVTSVVEMEKEENIAAADAVEDASAEKPARARKPRKANAKKEKKETVYIQCAGEEFEITAVLEKVRAATKSIRAVREVSVYVKPEEHRAYYVARKTRGEAVGSIEI